jgi:hypothetical protein
VSFLGKRLLRLSADENVRARALLQDLGRLPGELSLAFEIFDFALG